MEGFRVMHRHASHLWAALGYGDCGLCFCVAEDGLIANLLLTEQTFVS